LVPLRFLLPSFSYFTQLPPKASKMKALWARAPWLGGRASSTQPPHHPLHCAFPVFRVRQKLRCTLPSFPVWNSAINWLFGFLEDSWLNFPPRLALFLSCFLPGKRTLPSVWITRLRQNFPRVKLVAGQSFQGNFFFLTYVSLLFGYLFPPVSFSISDFDGTLRFPFSRPKNPALPLTFPTILSLPLRIQRFAFRLLSLLAASGNPFAKNQQRWAGHMVSPLILFPFDSQGVYFSF